MSGSKFLTWDGDVATSTNPHRPSGDELGGTDLVDDIEAPPSPDEPSADGWNEKARQIAAIAKVTTAARIEVHFSAGTPSIFRITGPRTGLAVGDLTVFDDGVGITRIKDASGKLPGRAMGPGGLTILSDTAAPSGAPCGTVFEVAANEIRIRTFLGTTPADLNFRFDWD